MAREAAKGEKRASEAARTLPTVDSEDDDAGQPPTHVTPASPAEPLDELHPEVLFPAAQPRGPRQRRQGGQIGMVSDVDGPRKRRREVSGAEDMDMDRDIQDECSVELY